MGKTHSVFHVSLLRLFKARDGNELLPPMPLFEGADGPVSEVDVFLLHRDVEQPTSKNMMEMVVRPRWLCRTYRVAGDGALGCRLRCCCRCTCGAGHTGKHAVVLCLVTQ
jgi:hypothetical protein